MLVLKNLRRTRLTVPAAAPPGMNSRSLRWCSSRFTPEDLAPKCRVICFRIPGSRKPITEAKFAFTSERSDQASGPLKQRMQYGEERQASLLFQFLRTFSASRSPLPCFKAMI